MLNAFKTLTSGIMAKVNKLLITSKADWNQNDSSQLNFIKNKPFYTEIKEGESVLADDTFTFEGINETLCKLESTCSFSLVSGDKYYVDFKGETYECVCNSLPSNDSVVYVGNIALVGGDDDTGEPFVISVLDGMMQAFALIPTVSTYDAAATYDYRIKIYQSGEQEIVHKIDKKYLPDSFKDSFNLLKEEVDNNYTYLNSRINTTNSNIVQSDWNETNAGSKAYIKNKPTIPEQVRSSWYETDKTSKAYIIGKPDMSDYVSKSEYVEPIQSDWNTSSSSDLSFIKNKPDLSVYVEEDSLKDYSFHADLRAVTVCSGNPNSSLPTSWLHDDSLVFYPAGKSATGMTDEVEITTKVDSSDIPYLYLDGCDIVSGATKRIKPRINNVGTPIEDYDAVNKLYVDSCIETAAVKHRIEKTSSDTTIELTSNEFYYFPTMSSLTVTLAVPENTSIVNEYHFMFTSGTTATTLTLPDNVLIPDNFLIESNRVYEISILENCMSYQSWAVG